jgi:tRNA (cmo5U34)-methyltransferase
VPFHGEENRDLLLANGFSYCEEFMRWYNFCGVVALK